MHDEDEDLYEVPPAEWTWKLPVFTLLSTISGIFDQIAQGISDTALGVVRHMNYEVQQKQFQEEAAREIERITSG